jgi:hypothetical protein
VPTLDLLSRQSDRKLLDAAKPVLDSLLLRQPENPCVLIGAVRYHEALGQERAAIDARRELANLKGYEDDPRKQEAALWLGKYFSQQNPDLAGTYLWNAMVWWYNSGNGGDLGSQITRAIERWRHIRKNEPHGSSIRGLKLRHE